jgi:hypothetical protein
MGPLESSRGRAARLPFILSLVLGPLRLSPPQHLAAGVLASVRGQRGAAYMMRSDKGKW